jgi:hypothetical protein
MTSRPTVGAQRQLLTNRVLSAYKLCGAKRSRMKPAHRIGELSEQGTVKIRDRLKKKGE